MLFQIRTTKLGLDSVYQGPIGFIRVMRSLVSRPSDGRGGNVQVHTGFLDAEANAAAYDVGSSPTLYWEATLQEA